MFKGQNKRKKEAKGKKRKYGWKDVKKKTYKQDAIEWGQYGPGWPPACRVGEGTRHYHSTPAVNIRTEVQY
jgi:hypothetical protein